MTETVPVIGPPPSSAGGGPIVVDLKKQKRGLVRRLRKGRGKLMAEVLELVAAMEAEGKVAHHAQTVIVVVRQKQRRRGLLGC